MSKEERKIHIKELNDHLEEAMIDMGPDKELNNYMNLTIFKIEDNKANERK
jgi:hypothetical protein